MAEEQNRTLQDKFMLRLPDGMRERIKAAADANIRSMNAEIVATLEDKYPAPDALTALREEMELLVAALRDQIPDSAEIAGSLDRAHRLLKTLPTAAANAMSVELARAFSADVSPEKPIDSLFLGIEKK